MFTVIKDTREKLGWDFGKTTLVKGLRSGDYTIQGLEDFFVIERKGSTGELARNIIEKRFERELERLEDLPHSFVILEFTIEDVLLFPINSGIPRRFWKKLRIGGKFIMKKVREFERKYKTKFIFAGNNGKKIANEIFKKMIESYGCQRQNTATS